MTTTTDLSKFGGRELKIAAILLSAYTNGQCPSDFDSDGLTIMMNMNSGYVFLTNENFEVAMMNGDRLESFYSCPYCGHEGFKEDMKHEPKSEECTEYMEEIGVILDPGHINYL